MDVDRQAHTIIPHELTVPFYFSLESVILATEYYDSRFAGYHSICVISQYNNIPVGCSIQKHILYRYHLYLVYDICIIYITNYNIPLEQHNMIVSNCVARDMRGNSRIALNRGRRIFEYDDKKK